MRWITVGPAGRPDMNIVLTPPAADPGVTDEERRTITEMMAKGTYASIMLATDDLSGLSNVQVAGAEVMQEPTDQPWGLETALFVIPPDVPSASRSLPERPRVSR